MFGRVIDNKTIKKTVEAFGTMFNNIKINRYDSSGDVTSVYKVPLDWSSKSKYVRRLQEMSGITDGPKVQIQLPRMGYEITGMSRNTDRALNQLTKLNNDETYSLKRTAYTVNFSLYVLTNTSEELWAILEQILPYFDPDVTLSIRDNDSLDTTTSMVVNFNGEPQIEDNYAGPLKDSTSREILATLSFTVTAVFYGPAITATRIETVLIDLNTADIDNDNNIVSSEQESLITVVPTVTFENYDKTNPDHVTVTIDNDIP